MYQCSNEAKAFKKGKKMMKNPIILLVLPYIVVMIYNSYDLWEEGEHN